METPLVKEKSNSRKKLRTILWILFPVFIILIVILLLITAVVPDIVFFTIAFLALADLIILYVMAEKFYNWPMVFVLIFILGFLFKRQHWPTAGYLLSVGIFFLCLTSLVNAVRLQIIMRHNPFLRWFGSVSCIIISTYMFGLLCNFQHWSKDVGNAFGYSGIVLFIISILGMVFTLPGSNFIGWSVTEKKTFFRAILIPMGIVFCFIILTIIFSDAFVWLLKSNDPPWNLSRGIELFNLEGIRKL